MIGQVQHDCGGEKNNHQGYSTAIRLVYFSQIAE
jgi:hypothetical protein